MNEANGGASATTIPSTAAAGDDRRFDELYRQWYPPVVRLCRRYMGRHGDAEAVAQESFLRAWLSWDSFADDRPFWPWMATIARRLCLNRRTTEARREEQWPKIATRVVPNAAHDDDLDRLLLLQEVEEALAQLTPRHRRLLMLREVEDWSYDDIARFDGVSIESVRGSLKRARASFRAAFESRGRNVVLGWVGVVRDRLSRVGRHVDRWSAGVLPRWCGPEGAALLAALLVAPTAGATTTPPDARVVAPVTITGTSSSATTTTSLPSTSGRQPPVQAVSTTSEDAEAPIDPAVGWSYKFTPSPNYEADHTIFASGMTTCPVDAPPSPLACGILLRSRDGGATWARLPATGRDVGALFLPPAFPSDPRIYSVSTAVMSVSVDDGRSFEVLATLGGLPRGPMPAVISPSSSAGEPHFVLGAPHVFGPLLPAEEYRDNDRRVRPVMLPLPAGAVPVSVAFSPSYATDGTMLVPSALPQTEVLADDVLSGRPDTRRLLALYSCTTTACERVSNMGRELHKTLVWSTGPRQTVFAWSWELERSRDRGRSFEPVALPPGWGITSFVAASDGRILLVTEARNLFSSDDDGDTWTKLDGHGISVIQDIEALIDGTLLASAPPVDGGGLRCSVDGGRTWHGHCRR